MKRYHVRLGERRTTVSLDNMLSDFLAIKLGCHGSDDEHKTVRLQLQKWIDDVGDPRQVNVSQYIHRCVYEYIADNKISAKYNEMIVAGE